MSTPQDDSFPWLNSEYIRTILIKYEGHEKIELGSWNVGSGSQQGENFAAVINRITVNYTSKGIQKTTKFILKSSSASGAVSELLEDLGVFEREVFTYEKIHRDIEALLPTFKMAPRYYKSFRYVLSYQINPCS